VRKAKERSSGFNWKNPQRLPEILLMAEILHQLIGSLSGLSHYSQGFVHPRWCRISSINSTNGKIQDSGSDRINSWNLWTNPLFCGLKEPFKTKTISNQNRGHFGF